MDRVCRFQSELVQKTTEATAVDDENKDQVRYQSLTAYSALLKVVEILLKVENGDRRLSRQDPAIVTTLDEAAGHFYTLSEMSRENANQLGKYAAQFMALGDQAAAFVGDLQSYADVLSTDTPHILEVVNLYKSTLEKAQHRTQELKRQMNAAEESLGVSTQR